MSLAGLFVAFGDTPVGQFMNRSTWAFATIESVHLLSLAVLGGAVVLLGLAALGAALRQQPLAATARGLAPVFLTALAVMIATGTLLVGSKPYRYYLSDPFRLKMLLLVLGIIAYGFVHRALIAGRDGPTPSLRIGGGILITLWLGVGLSGRFIGLF